jgi:polysaccharide export outer membrane protein
MKHILSILVVICLFSSCANKKEILYLQDSEAFNNTIINYSSPNIQPNDILNITVGALEAEAAIPYNKSTSGSGQGVGIELLKLGGYIVSENNTITFPQLGDISTKEKTVLQLQEYIKKRLEEGGHLNNPPVFH